MVKRIGWISVIFLLVKDQEYILLVDNVKPVALGERAGCSMGESAGSESCFKVTVKILENRRRIWWSSVT